MRKILKKDIEMFERKLRDAEKAEATIKKYTAAIKKLEEWLDGQKLTKQAVLAYRDYLLQTRTARTVNGVISAINVYLDMCGMPECRIKLIKVQRKMFRAPEQNLTRSEYMRLIEAAEKSGKKRLNLLMETICATGIRVSEVKYITVETAREGKAEILLKGKARTVFIAKKLCHKLLKYANRNGIKAGEIFITRNGTSLSRKQIWHEMKELCEAAGVEETKVFPHNLRHLFARCFYKECQDVATLADVLGHSSIETTRVYLASTGEDYMRELDKLQLVA